jgi:sialic acid synthase SpsE
MDEIAEIQINGRTIGAGHPCLVIAEIGINHNGDLELAKRLIDAAVLAGCDAVKFQKRSPALCVPETQRDLERDTPWGRITYLEYRRRIEFGEAEYEAVDAHCRQRNILWSASCWDEPSLRFVERFDPPFLKVPSGHEVGLQITLAAVALGASVVERHLTLDRAMWGTDQAASVEPYGMQRLVRDVRVIEAALGDGVKRVYESELPVRAKLRWWPGM